jgi:TetR/AcrR family acrAB operon transcriptional repressor
MSAATRTRRREDAEPSRKQLMAAAIDAFARHGYQGTSIDRIARDVGVTKGAVYYHFRDKEELLFEAVKDRVGEFEKHVLKDVVPGHSALATLRQVVDACFFHATVSNHRRFIITLMVEALDTHPTLSAEFRAILQAMREFLIEVVRHGQAHGQLRSDVDPSAVASAYVAGIMGAEIQHYQDPEQIDLRSVLDTLLEQLAAWIAVAPTRRTSLTTEASRS